MNDVNPQPEPADHAVATRRSPGRPRKDNAPYDTGTAEMIVRHAKRLFMQSGYAAVSISAIVEAVGITKPTLYYYYADKESLYAAVLADTMRRGGQYLTQAIADHADRPARAVLLFLATGFFRNAPASLAMLMRDASEHLDEDRLAPVLEAHDRHIIQPFAGLLEAAMARNEIRRQDPVALAFIVIGLLDTLVVSFTLRFSRKFAYAQLAESTIDNLMDGIGISV